MKLKLKVGDSQQLFIVIALFSIFHVVTAATISLGDDEAYYWQWSQHLDLSYYDHPPLIAWLIWLTSKLCGNSPFAVRLSNLIILPLVSYVIYQICDYLYHNKKFALKGVVVFNFITTFFVGALFVSPDVPLVLFYTLALYLFILIIYLHAARLWYLLGLVVGMGMLSKYIMLFFILGAFLYLALNRQCRYWLRRKEPYLALSIVFIIFTPVLIWNYQHHWASFRFQFFTRHFIHLNIGRFFKFIALQLLAISPIFGIAMIIGWAKRFQDKDVMLLSYFSLPVFVIFALIALITSVRFNWTIIAFIPLVIIFAGTNDKFFQEWKWGIIITLICFSVITLHAYYPIIKVKSLLKNDPTNDFYSWQPVAKQIDDFFAKKGVNSANWFVFANRFQSAAQIDYNLNGRYPVYSLPNNLDGGSFWQNESKIIGLNGLLVMNNAYAYKPGEKYKCGKIKLFKVIDIIRAGTLFRKAFIYQCYNYQGRS